jgi:hypothetical protein
MNSSTTSVLKASWESWLDIEGDTTRGPGWLQWGWSLLLALVLAVAFTVAGMLFSGFAFQATSHAWLHWFGKNFVVTAVVSLLIHALFNLTRATWVTKHRLASWGGWQRFAYFAGVPLLGVALGWPMGASLAGFDLSEWFATPRGQRLLLVSATFSIAATLVMQMWFSAKARQIQAERRVTEAQLRLLQAQIEPHFLFNTLANIHSLIDVDAPRAQQMLGTFTDYLRASLGQLRQDLCPLEAELSLAQAYLGLQRMRMGARLQFDMQADESARAAMLPPLLLQPLVENAVLHGLEPSVTGGRIVVRARLETGLDGKTLVITVEDSTEDAPQRKKSSPGHGMALTNIHERLNAQFGDEASLRLASSAQGTCATLSLPVGVGRE